MYIRPSEPQKIQQIRLYGLSAPPGLFLTFRRELNHPKRYSCSPPLTRRRNSLIKPPQNSRTVRSMSSTTKKGGYFYAYIRTK